VSSKNHQAMFDLRRERDEVRAEVKRLQNLYPTEMMELFDQIKSLKAENARLVKGGNYLAQLLLDGEGSPIEGWEEISDLYEEGGIQAIGRFLQPNGGEEGK